MISAIWAVIGLAALIYVLRAWRQWANRGSAMPQRLGLGPRMAIHGSFGLCSVGALGLLTFGLVGAMR